MIMTENRRIILAETKGEHLKNDDSREKISLGQSWSQVAGRQYRYYMVCRDDENLRERQKIGRVLRDGML